jgi:hypothetical protein
VNMKIVKIKSDSDKFDVVAYFMTAECDFKRRFAATYRVRIGRGC